jgi:hypothetical protein
VPYPWDESGGGGGSGGFGPESPNLPSAKDIDRAACEAYRALAKKYGGIPTGRTEAGARLYAENGQVKFSDIIKYTAPPNEPIALKGLDKVSVPGALVGFIHTHPYNAGVNEHGKLSDPLIGNVSQGDLDHLNSYPKFIGRAGYVTTEFFWMNKQIIKFQTKNGSKDLFSLIDCNR